MSKYEYKIIINDLPQRGIGNGTMQPDVVVVHHSAVKTEGHYDVIQRLSQYANNHISRIGNPGLSYHFYIPRLDNDNNIYITRYFNQIQWHCSNGGFNRRSVAILVEGDFTQQDPTEVQLRKLKKLLDEIHTIYDNDALKNLNPKDNKTRRVERGITLVGGLAGHNEVAEKGFGTQCPGKLLNYVNDYRANKGNVAWFKEAPSPVPIDPIDPCESKINFVAGNLQSRITQLEEELDSSKNNTAYQAKVIEDLQRENADFKQSVMTDNNVYEELSNSLKYYKEEYEKLKNLDNTQVINLGAWQKQVISNVEKALIENWKKMPRSLRYILPNIVAYGVSLAIPLINGWNLETISFAGITGATIKSLIIGYLQGLSKKLEDANKLFPNE